jgi:hypothetical protein
MDQLLTLIYGATGVAAAALYLPQIRTYHRNRATRCSISLVTWGGWIAIACVTILYGVFVIDNMLIAAIAGLNALAQLVVLGYGIAARPVPVGITGLGSKLFGRRAPSL